MDQDSNGPASGHSPSAWQTTPFNVKADEPSTVWREKYLRARRRAQVLAASTTIAALAAVGGIAWGLAQSGGPDTVVAGTQGLVDGREPPEGFAPGEGPGGFGGQFSDVPRGGALLGQLFNDDGSVNADSVQQFLSTLPEGRDPSTMIEGGLERGAITQEQADALLEAFSAAGVTSGSSV